MTTQSASPSDATAAGGLTDGFHLVADALKANDVATIYGIVGIPITDLARTVQARGIRYIGFRHEASAANAAAAAGFLTARPGVCLTTSGPGFLNALPALANATANCFPMIQISGSSQRAIVDLARGDYQEIDQLNAARPFAKAAYRINRVEDVGLGIARALRTAISGRPGGVYLDVPGEVLGQAMDATAAAATVWRLVDPAPRQLPAPEAVDRALTILSQAQRPLIVLGKGAAYAQADNAIRDFIETTGIPFLPMSMAKGLLPDSHPCSAGAARSLAIARADAVLLIGARLNWLLGHGESPQWSADAKFIQVDIAASEFDSNRPIAAPLTGDIGSVMAALSDGLARHPIATRAPWTTELAERKARNEAKMLQRLAEDPHPMRFYNALGAIRTVLHDNPDVYVVNEGANALDLARNVIDMQLPRHRIDTGTWGVMGIGMGYSIAAAVETGRPVVAIEGDSAFGFSGMEVETICRYQLPVTVVILNNGGVYRGDEATKAQATDASPNDPAPTVLSAHARHELIAEAFGGKGYHVTTPTELRSALTAALASNGPTVIDCELDPAAGVESGHLASLNPTSAATPARVSAGG
ncbi:oxalyl-CoA decarboxylase [Mycobacterium marinum]|uniref:oxalyl-CoA decarboxylase n=1 Tax=Mycobacterium marinum TaxID=1781 RepID=UPI000B960AE3|nr:oxalyl-CoA decarboxylase [Mycobacterium marinum]MDC8971737.1 oxalyl-CoA decarboxylase [Mycobacterium marinum]MDC8982999.1 oxalyl-CoA decarboxylase [Mycobacterium marinum]MDC8994031.1 oxalyl-CoA decarboxylase [Mycobacterium marinum]MDC8999640.1 oxalyl-CoA decarboxylase [Mycobacterium marinum]MDC9010279.1 oxalyl-CoA decarboxylase [Mycobacterium marinum]